MQVVKLIQDSKKGPVLKSSTLIKSECVLRLEVVKCGSRKVFICSYVFRRSNQRVCLGLVNPPEDRKNEELVEKKGAKGSAEFTFVS